MKRVLMLMAMYAALLLHTACEHEKTEEEEVESKFTITGVIKKDTSTVKEYVCQIHSFRNIELRAFDEGYLEGFYVDEGQYVQKGKLLFRIMPMIYQAELEKARAEANYAKIEYQNTKSLADSDVVSPNELALAKAKYDKAKAELNLAQVHMNFTEIHAPFDGIINRLHVREGSLVEEGELLTTLSDNSKMWVYFNVPEAEYLNYKTKVKNDSLMKVKLLMANNEVFKHTGIVETIEAEFNNETGNIAFRATFPNPEGLLRHGETGNIRMRVPVKNALIIPQKATFEILDKKYVFVVDEEDRVNLRRIKIGSEMPHLYTIAEGLEEGEKILLDGLRKVRNKDEIAYEFQEPDSVISHLDLYAE